MSSNTNYKPSEGKREEFRKYLEKNGVMDALTKVLVNLYEETNKPEDALEYMRDKLAVQAGLDTNSQMKAKIEELEAKIAELEQQIVDLQVGKDGTGSEEEGRLPGTDEGAPEDGPPKEEDENPPPPEETD